MRLPQDPVVWVVLIIGAMIVVLFALWRGNVVEVTTNPLGLRFKRNTSGERRGAGARNVSVGDGMTITETDVGGDIVGKKSDDIGDTKDGLQGSIRVLNKAKIEKTTIQGDIAGHKRSRRN